MSDKIEITAHETGVVRVFAVDIPADQIATFTARNDRWPLRDALGAETLDPDHIDVFDTADLTGVGLPGYLAEGHAIPEDQLAPMRERLAAQTGAVMVVTSRAFAGTAQTLSPRAPLSLIASFSEARSPITFGALPDASAQPQQPEPEAQAPRKKPSDAAMSGRIAMIVLLVLAVLVAVMVWIAA
ncbi:hypothetical protein DC366_13085 [Pelagivirga sediminicola]|uniref:Aspartate carbamoyltransferase catalytic subunit n=1 Tax=Pelagivirga sediminicola TaxID=2170575 RepID=A0A2T7G5F7_9RHOB|nr:hypothetical protein [Pelagivirga sediminicola]PVA09617.1 hypothetical protein DC366_13085 [Pelagivirga sediminicola]